MPFSLAASEREVAAQLERLKRILTDMPQTAQSRYALSEIVLIRAASLFEEAIAAVAYKTACGASFPGGSVDG